MNLPLLARVDSRAGSVEGPFSLRPGEQVAGDNYYIGATDEAVWVRGNGHLTRFDVEKLAPTRYDIPGTGLAVGAEGVWVVVRTSQLARVSDDGTTSAIDIPAERPFHLAAAHGSVWVLDWTHVPGGCTVLRLDPSTGSVEQTYGIEGDPQALLVDETGVWVDVWRNEGGTIGSFLVGIDPSEDGLASEVHVAPTGARGGVERGHVWAMSADPYAHAERGLPTELRRLDARSGTVDLTVPIPGWLTWMVAGHGALWGCLEQRGAQRWTVLEVGSEGVAKEWDLSGLDVTPYVPPPPPKIDPEKVERDALERLRGAFFGGWVRTDPDTGEKTNLPFIRGVTFEEVRLDGEFPKTEVVVFFRADEHPGLLFGRRRRIWEDDGEYSGVVDVMDINLMEDVEACGYGLPAAPEPDDSGIVWF